MISSESNSFVPDSRQIPRFSASSRANEACAVDEITGNNNPETNYGEQNPQAPTINSHNRVKISFAAAKNLCRESFHIYYSRIGSHPIKLNEPLNLAAVKA